MKTTIKLEIDKELDQLQLADILLSASKFIMRQGDMMEDLELMDGSYRIPTCHGAVFLSFEKDEDEIEADLDSTNDQKEHEQHKNDNQL